MHPPIVLTRGRQAQQTRRTLAIQLTGVRCPSFPTKPQMTAVAGKTRLHQKSSRSSIKVASCAGSAEATPVAAGFFSSRLFCGG